MIKKKLKADRGIALLSLSIAVIVILVITSTVIYNVQGNLGMERVRNMQNDIENLRDKIDLYYVQYGTIPKIDEEYTNTEGIDVIGINDTGKFYIIDLSSIEGLTLTYGEDFRNINSVADINTLEDIYIINEDSHNVFYVKGITFEGNTYYTDYTTSDMDTQRVELIYE